MIQIDKLNKSSAQKLINSPIPNTILDSFNEKYSIDDNIIQFYQKNGFVKLENVLIGDALTFSNKNISAAVFLRKEHEYLNVLLVEQPNTDFAYVITRQFLFDVYHLLFLNKLKNSNDITLSAIANKAIKEVSYHYRFSSDWIKRLGDGTEESHKRIQKATMGSKS